jgi:peptidoglycan/xylan/chitin deacetylase (PgdA/CDA1 family)
MNNLKHSIFKVVSLVLQGYPVANPQVIQYHRIASKNECKESPVVCDDVDAFTKQMNYLLEEGYYFASLDEIVQHVKGEISLPGKSMAITFDDGFQDNFTYAYPVLKERNIKATIFLNTAFIGKALPYRDTFWQPSCTVNTESIQQFLSWKEIEIMHADVIDFDPHTHTHVNLTEVSELQAEEEIGISKKIVEQKLGKISKHFCYPYGLWNARIITLVKKHGFAAAWTVSRENIARGLTLYHLPRRGVGGYMPIYRFRVAVSPLYKYFPFNKAQRVHKADYE